MPLLDRVSCVLIAALVNLCAMAGFSYAQVRPDRVYYGVNRPVPMTVSVPEGVEGEAQLELYAFGAEEPEATAAVLPGGVDVASLFPTLWTNPPSKAMALQLRVGGRKTGPPVIVQPMLTPRTAELYHPQKQIAWYTDPATRQPTFPAKEGEVVWTGDPPLFTGLRCYVDALVLFETTAGPITVRLRPDEAPNTVYCFRELVEGGFYTDIEVHRVSPRTRTGAPFLVQFGDPTATGFGSAGEVHDLEPSRLPHDFGVLSMARGPDPNSNGSQVLIALSREGTQHLDGKFTSFGQAVDGAEAILALEQTPVRGDRPTEPPRIVSARLVEALPFGEGLPPVRRPAADAPVR